MRRVTVILPAYNEEKTVGQVIDLVKKNKEINEVIVIDNNSSDNTANIAFNRDAKIISCKEQGKGCAIKKGIEVCNTEFVLFLDSDVTTYDENIVEMMVKPLLENEADFVKSTFNRHQGRVTELTARPLLKILFPHLYKYSQPLSGMIAGKLELFKKIDFKCDYGVDVGILIDMDILNARIKEVHIGTIEHNSKELVSLTQMAYDVSKVILEKGGIYEENCISKLNNIIGWNRENIRGFTGENKEEISTRSCLFE